MQGLKRMRHGALGCYWGSYLIRHPGSWINHAIEDYVASALDEGQHVRGSSARLYSPQGTLETYQE